MALLEYAGIQYDVEDNETVLDALLRQGIEVPNSCRAGACQCCMMRATEGVIPPQAQVGLKPSLKEQGYFLSCACKPLDSMKLESPGEGLQFTTSIVGLRDLGASVIRVDLAVPDGFVYRAGQFLTLINPDGIARSYSLASLPSDPTLELHIRMIPGGLMSTWLADSAKVGDAVKIAGPSGECFYTSDAPERPLILIGTGTGLAPLYGIVRDALTCGHTGDITLYHGALDPAGLYHCEMLETLDQEYENFQYYPCVLRDGNESIRTGALDQLVLSDQPSLKNHRAYLCGNPDLVKMLKKKFFLSGMNMKDIYMDAFIPSAGK